MGACIPRRVWWLRTRNGNGKRVSISFKSEVEAHEAARKVEAAVVLGQDYLTTVKQEPAVKVPTFADVAEQWFERYPKLNAVKMTTLQNYRSFYRNHLEPHFGKVAITAITPEAVEDFIAVKRSMDGSVRRKGKALSDSSLRVGLISFRLVMRFALRRRFIQENPLTLAEWRPARSADNIDPFTLAELEAIVRAADSIQADFGLLLRLWVQSGMRRGEVAALQVADIDLTAGTAKISKTWSRERLGESTKTGIARTSSFLHPIIEDTLECEPSVTWAHARSVLSALQVAIVTANGPEAFLFGGKAPMDQHSVDKLWSKTVNVAGVRYRSPEQLRHTFCSTMLSRGANLLYTAEQAGHTVTTMLKFYARFMPRTVRPSTIVPPERGGSASIVASRDATQL
ncbi:MAG TPA: tyrosine-type recombinase/integrase [Methylomirabilota bacterium]|nr:tyrosine-type recombinase/integrase [Methylomirabilota bacterium]